MKLHRRKLRDLGLLTRDARCGRAQEAGAAQGAEAVPVQQAIDSDARRMHAATNGHRENVRQSCGIASLRQFIISTRSEWRRVPVVPSVDRRSQATMTGAVV